jgi:hypothetical protein
LSVSNRYVNFPQLIFGDGDGLGHVTSKVDRVLTRLPSERPLHGP